MPPPHPTPIVLFLTNFHRLDRGFWVEAFVLQDHGNEMLWYLDDWASHIVTSSDPYAVTCSCKVQYV